MERQIYGEKDHLENSIEIRPTSLDLAPLIRSPPPPPQSHQSYCVS